MEQRPGGRPTRDLAVNSSPEVNGNGYLDSLIAHLGSSDAVMPYVLQRLTKIAPTVWARPRPGPS